MEECLTIPFMPEFSGCLVEKPTCNFAVRCGFSFHCHHPNHGNFTAGNSDKGRRLDLPSRYRELKEIRRVEYLAGVMRSDQYSETEKDQIAREFMT